MGRGSWGALLFFMVCAGSAQGIILGKIVNPADDIARSTVMLLQTGFLETGRGQCSGTLVAKDLILTAAHCVVNLETGETYPASRFRIYFGNLEREGNGPHDWKESRAREVKQVIAHPEYNPLLDPDKDFHVHDIALVRIKDEAPSDFREVKLLSDLSILTPMLPVTIAGYGNIKFYGDPEEPRSRRLRSFQTKIRDAQSSRTGMVTFYRPSQVSTQEEYIQLVGGMAAGDSGGPGFVKHEEQLYVFGVASGYRHDIPSYESVPHHLQWLRDSAVKLGSSL